MALNIVFLFSLLKMMNECKSHEFKGLFVKYKQAVTKSEWPKIGSFVLRGMSTEEQTTWDYYFHIIYMNYASHS